MGIAAFCAAGLLTVYRQRVAAVYRHSRKCEGDCEDAASALPLSVIVYCNDTPSSLERMLGSLLTQHYSAPYEVIIVNDGSSESVKDVFNRLSLSHHNLYQTFIPSEAHNLSRRKLAMTLGVKAARNKHVLFLNASSTLPSQSWLQKMGRHFAAGKEVVIGYAVYDKDDDTALGKRSRSYDTAADAITYLSAALRGATYRGHLENIGFNRELFFANKGFSRSLNLHNGIDDIFVEEISTPDNSAVELSDDSIVTLTGDKPRTMHRRSKWSHIFTGRFVSKRERRVFGLCSLLLWLGTAAAVAAIIIGLPNLLPAAAMVAVGISVWVTLVVTWRKALIALKARKLFLTLPWLIMMRPIYNTYYRMVERRHRSENFTWSKPR